MKWLFLSYMLQFSGVPYRWGGDNPLEGMDCSGFVQTVFQPWGMDPAGDQTAHGLYVHFKDRGDRWDKDPKSAPLGSLAFYGTRTKITHISVSTGYGFMMEAGGGDSTTVTVDRAMQQDAYVRIRPIERRTDLVEIIVPHQLPWLM